MPQNQCALPCWALCPAYSDSRPLMQESLKCPGLVLEPETAPVPVPAACSAGSLTQPCPASALSHVRDGWLCPSLPNSACRPCCCSPHHHPRPPLPLTLPLVFFSFLQTRQATKVLNPTRVPKASPPATTMPSSGTSTRVARSPADCPLVSLQVGGTPNPTCHGSIYSVLGQGGRGQLIHKATHRATRPPFPFQDLCARLTVWQARCLPGSGSEALVTPTSLVATTERLCARLRSCSCTVWFVSQG